MKRLLTLSARWRKGWVLAILMAFMLPFAFDAGAVHVYFKPDGNWTQSSARFALYYYGNGDGWVSMTSTSGLSGVYDAELPSGYTNFIIVRLNGSSSANNWGNKWNQSADLTYPTADSYYNKSSNSAWDSWSVTPTTVPTFAPYLQTNNNVNGSQNIAFTKGTGNTYYIDVTSHAATNFNFRVRANSTATTTTVGVWGASGTVSSLNTQTTLTSSTTYRTFNVADAVLSRIELEATNVKLNSNLNGYTATMKIKFIGTAEATASTTIYYYQASGSTPNIAIDHSNNTYDVASTAMTSAGNGWYSYTYTQATSGTYSLTIGGQTLTGLSYSATSSYTLSSSPIAANSGKLVAYVPNGTSNVASAVTVKLHKPSGWTTGYVSLQASGASAPYYQAALSDDSFAGWYTVTIPAASLPSSGVNINFTNGSTNLWGTWTSAPTAAACYGNATTATLVADPSTYTFYFYDWGDNVTSAHNAFIYNNTNKVYAFDATSKDYPATVNFILMNKNDWNASNIVRWGNTTFNTFDTWSSALTTGGGDNSFTKDGYHVTGVQLDASAVEVTTDGVYSGSVKLKFTGETYTPAVVIPTLAFRYQSGNWDSKDGSINGSGGVDFTQDTNDTNLWFINVTSQASADFYFKITADAGWDHGQWGDFAVTALGTQYTSSTSNGNGTFNVSGATISRIELDASGVSYNSTSGKYEGALKVKFIGTAVVTTYDFDVYFVKPSSWDFTPFIYTWGPELAGNPGTQMTQVDGNLYKYSFTGNTSTSCNVMFNSGQWNTDGGTQTNDSYNLTGITDGASYYLTSGGTNVELISGAAAADAKAFYLHDWDNVMGLGNFVQFQWDSTNSVYYIDVTGKTLPTTFNVLPVGSNDYNYGYWQNGTISTVNTAVTLAHATSGDAAASITLPRGTTVTRLELDGSAVTEYLGTTSGTAYTTGNITVKAVGTLPTTKNVTVRFFRPIWNDADNTDWSNTPYLAYSFNSDFSGDQSVAMTAITDAAYASTKGTWYQATISGVLTTDNLYVRFHDGEGWDKYTVAGGQYEISGAPDVVCLTLETAKGDSGYYGVFADSNDKWKSAKIAEASCPDYAKWDKPLTIHFYRQRFPHAAEWTNTPVAVVYAGNYPYDLELTYNTTESSSYVAWYDVTIPANTIPATEFNVAMRNGANAADGQTSLWYVSEADAATMADICATMMQAASGKNHTLRKETCPGTTVEYYFFDAGNVIPNTNGNVYTLTEPTSGAELHFVKFTQLSPHYFYIDIPEATNGLWHNYKITTGVGMNYLDSSITDWDGNSETEAKITLPNEWKKLSQNTGNDAQQYATDHIAIKRIFINDFNVNDTDPRLWVSFEQEYPLYLHTWTNNTQDHSQSQYEHVDVGAENNVFTELTGDNKKFKFITDILVANNIPAGNSYQVAYGIIFPEPLEVKEDRIKQGEGFLVRYGGTDSDETNSFLQCDESSYIVSDQFEATGLQGVGGHTWHRDYGVLKGAYNAIFLVRDEQDPTQLFVIASSKGSAEGHQVDQDIEQRTATRDICLGASMTWTNPTNLDGLGIKGIFPCKQIYKIVNEDGSDLLTFDAIGNGTTDISSQLVTNIATYYGLPYNGRFYVELDFSIGIKAGKWFDFEVVTDIAKPVESINLSTDDVMCAESSWGHSDHADSEFQYVADFDWTMPSDAYIVNQYEVFAYDSDLYDSPEEAEAANALATCVVESNGVVHTGDYDATYKNPLTVHSDKDSSKQTVNLTYGVRPLYKVYFLEHPTTDEAAALAATYPSAGSRLRAASISSFDNVEAEPTTKTLALNNVVTGILGIDADRMPVRGIYNLQGQRVRETIPGQFYIINGKKTMVNSVIRDTDF